MALLKKKQRACDSLSTSSADSDALSYGIDELCELLDDPSPAQRRLAARCLRDYNNASPLLVQRLEIETDLAVRQVIFDSLMLIGGEQTVILLIPLLKSEDANLRNNVIEVLQTLPAEVAPSIADLLTDEDSDVRIFAIDVLRELAHPKSPDWLWQVIKTDTHVNVIGTAIDRLAEIGRPEMIPDLKAVKQRFDCEGYIGFCVDVCLKRLSEV